MDEKGLGGFLATSRRHSCCAERDHQSLTRCQPRRTVLLRRDCGDGPASRSAAEDELGRSPVTATEDVAGSFSASSPHLTHGKVSTSCRGARCCRSCRNNLMRCESRVKRVITEGRKSSNTSRSVSSLCQTVGTRRMTSSDAPLEQLVFRKDDADARHLWPLPLVLVRKDSEQVEVAVGADKDRGRFDVAGIAR